MNLALIGLIIDMIGVVMLFIFGMPSGYINNPKEQDVTMTPNKKEQEKAILNNSIICFFSYSGLVLILIGLLLQAIACL